MNMTDNELIGWLEERRANCARIAATKSTPADIAGWIEDADYFKRAIERIAALEAENARLSAPVTDADQITFCSYIDPFDGEKEVGNWDSKRIELMIAARKGTA